jgi:hypothetical protein
MTPRSTAKLILAGICGSALLAQATPWKFGIISDTQWQLDQDGQNPNTVAAGIINQVNKAFVSQGVKFVVALGDLADRTEAGGDSAVNAIDTRATLAQELYNSRIGFFPLRGNHDDNVNGASEILRVFPQNSNGVHNKTPSSAFNWADSSKLHNPARVSDADSFTVGSGFSSPNAHLKGLSYAFTYNNATLVLLDQFTPADTTGGFKNAIDSQLTWLDSALGARPAGTHGFVFAHKGLITSNHQDVLFGNTPALDTVGTNTFIRTLQNRNVRFFINGHDHMHEFSRVSTTDATTAHVHELTAASDSYKFYTPVKPANDSINIKAFGVSRQIPVAQKLYDVGYYVVTVDSANATIEYYGVPSGSTNSITTTPQLTGNWKRQQTLGNSLVGREFVVAQGGAYTSVVDTFSGTVAKILAGTNTASTADLNGRAFSQLVNTGWSLADSVAGQSSRILSLWGLAPVYGTDSTAQYVLSLSYDSAKTTSSAAVAGSFGLATRDSVGTWKNAVSLNYGGTPSFKARAWVSTDSLGAWGVDTLGHTVWAVLNHASDFAAAGSLAAPTSLNARGVSVQAIRLVGRNLVVPSTLAGRTVDVQIRSQNGRLLSSFSTTSSTVELPASAHGVVLVRMRAPGADAVESRVLTGL